MLSSDWSSRKLGMPWNKLFVISLLYFAEGIPFGFINNALSVYFRAHKMSLEHIGLISLIGLAWSIKFLWAPLVDRLGKRHYWMFPSQIILGLSMLVMPLLNPSHPGIILWFVVGVMALASATQDMAIDAYTIDILDDHELGIANGIRSSSYRVALILSGGGLVALSGLIGWNVAFVAIAVIVLSLGVMVLFWKRCHESQVERKSSNPVRVIDSWTMPVRELFKRPGIGAIVLFILLFKVGDTMMGPMIAPFWVDRGFTRLEIGLISGTLGPIASIVGSVIGGWLTTRWGIGRALWSMGAVQALSNLGYAYAALTGGKFTVYMASFIESLTGGMGTAPFMAFLMALCNKGFSATQYAFFTTLFGFSRSISGVLGGFGAGYFGYASFFVLTFIAAIPAFLFLPWVLPVIRERSEQARVETT